MFRTAHDSSTDEDLRTGIAGAEFKVAFEIDDINPTAREGWSVLIQGPAHHVESETEHASVLEAGVEPWAGGVKGSSSSVSPLLGSPAGAIPGGAEVARVPQPTVHGNLMAAGVAGRSGSRPAACCSLRERRRDCQRLGAHGP